MRTYLKNHRKHTPKVRLHKTFLLILLLPLACIQGTAWSKDATASSSKEAASKIKQIEQKITLAQKSLSTARKDYSRQEKKLAKINNQLSANSSKSLKLEQSIIEVEGTLKELEKQTDEQKKVIYNHHTWLKEDLVNSYQSGTPSQIAMLLNQKHPATATRMMEYSEYIDAARKHKIEQLETHKQRLHELTAQTNLESEGLQAKVKELKKQAKNYKTLKQKQAKVLAKIKQQVKNRQGRIYRFKKDRAQLDTLMNELIALESVPPSLEQSPFSKLKGKLMVPVKGKISKASNKNNRQGVKRKGIWIDTQKGQTIHAVHHGQVIFSEWLRGYGQLIIIDHGDQFYTLYGHNTSMLKKPGDWVMMGDPIAIAGETTSISSPNGGIIGQSRLYFEIRHKGKAINPSGWLAAGRSSAP